MKNALAALLLFAAACSSSSGGGEKRTEADFENEMASSLMFDPGLLKVGDRVVYFVKRTGETETQKYSWSAVAEDRGSIWVENSVPWNTKRAIYKSKWDRSSKMVLEQWAGEPGGGAGQTFPPPTGSAPTAPPKAVRDSAGAKADTKEEPDRIVVGGKPYDCTRVTTVLAYPDGRKSTMTNWFSKDVPFAPTRALGGLVKRQFGRLTMEIVTGDRNAKAELQIPQK
ncbi:MAG TPA: hypothetical protein VNM14_14230 [Planctomycetota bacterium]|jgi:hypothetical protein|nr:hypothetical protein [Planctomycetota bacterium]